MARTRRRLTKAEETPAADEVVDPILPAFLAKARLVAATAAGLRRDAARAQALAHLAQVREALTRTELTVALNQTLQSRAELARRLRETSLAAYGVHAKPLRRHNRLSRLIDQVLVRLGPWGRARVILRSGLWRGPAEAAVAYAGRGADPHAQPAAPFDQAWHLAQYPDIAAGRLAPLAHYLVTGAREGRSPHPLFDAAWYAGRNAAELGATGLSGLEHFVRVGAAQGRNPHPLFDLAHYLSQAPALAPGEDPLSHYVREGAKLGLSPHPLFDPAWYGEQTPDRDTPGLIHYLAQGWREGLSPHPLFDPAWYRDQNPEVAAADLEPLTHFVRTGAFAGRDPSPWFDMAYYTAARGAGLAPGANPLIDYLQGGAWAVVEPRPGFPTAAYLAGQPDLVAAGLTPLEHWARRAGH